MATQMIQGFSDRLDIEEYRFLVTLKIDFKQSSSVDVLQAASRDSAVVRSGDHGICTVVFVVEIHPCV